MKVPIAEIQIKAGRRSLDTDHVKEMSESIRELGLLNPITIDERNQLIAGLHRLEAVKMLGWTDVECMVSSLDGLQAELAEIDENVVRSDLSAVEYGEMLLRRKEIYETLHPETKAGVAQAIAMNRAIGNNVADKISSTSKSFVEDTAEKLNVTPRTVRREIQTAKNLTPEAKEVMKNAGAKISKKTVMKLSQLEPEQQKEAAGLLAAKEIKTVEEYAEKAGRTSVADKPEQPLCPKRITKIKSQSIKTEDVLPPKNKQKSVQQTSQKETNEVSVSISEVPETLHLQEVSLKEVISELKNPDKDCSGTPESFLEEYAAFVRKFHKEIAWYSDPYYDTVYPSMNQEQLAILQEMTASLCDAAKNLFDKVERVMNT